jgi:hypothetical protein
MRIMRLPGFRTLPEKAARSSGFMLLAWCIWAITNVFALLRMVPGRDKDVEILGLRHQLVVLQRQLDGQRSGTPIWIRRHLLHALRGYETFYNPTDRTRASRRSAAFAAARTDHRPGPPRPPQHPPRQARRRHPSRM